MKYEKLRVEEYTRRMILDTAKFDLTGVRMEISFTICQQANRSTDKKVAEQIITSTGGIIVAKISRLGCLGKLVRTSQQISIKQGTRHQKDMIRVLLVQFLQLRTEFSFCRTG